jgi:hypothetical protein
MCGAFINKHKSTYGIDRFIKKNIFITNISGNFLSLLVKEFYIAEKGGNHGRLADYQTVLVTRRNGDRRD